MAVVPHPHFVRVRIKNGPGPAVAAKVGALQIGATQICSTDHEAVAIDYRNSVPSANTTVAKIIAEACMLCILKHGYLLLSIAGTLSTALVGLKGIRRMIVASVAQLDAIATLRICDAPRRAA